MANVAMLALRKFRAVPDATFLPVNDMARIIMHIHEAKELSPEVVRNILRASAELSKREKNIMEWDSTGMQAPQIRIFANTSFTHPDLYRLFSAPEIRVPHAKDNKFIFLGYKFNESPEKIRGLLSLLTYKLMFPNSICILRSDSMFEDPSSVAPPADLTPSKSSLFRRRNPRIQDNAAPASPFEESLQELRTSLPISLVVDKQLFVTNGFVGHRAIQKSLSDLNELDRFDYENFELFEELVNLGLPSESKETKEDTRDSEPAKQPETTKQLKATEQPKVIAPVEAAVNKTRPKLTKAEREEMRRKRLEEKAENSRRIKEEKAKKPPRIGIDKVVKGFIKKNGLRLLIRNGQVGNDVGTVPEFRLDSKKCCVSFTGHSFYHEGNVTAKKALSERYANNVVLRPITGPSSSSIDLGAITLKHEKGKLEYQLQNIK